jgi:hypothetical protein
VRIDVLFYLVLVAGWKSGGAQICVGVLALGKSKQIYKQRESWRFARLRRLGVRKAPAHRLVSEKVGAPHATN